MTQRELENVLAEHKKWLDGNGGKRAHLEGAYLEGADLEGAHLEGADLEGAHLEGADLEGAHLEHAHLEGADLVCAYLEHAHLEGAHLEHAHLEGAHLEHADLVCAYLQNADYASLQCPEFGSFIGWKKCREGKIVKLEICADAKRSSATSRKCRCSKAKVLEVQDIDGNKLDEYAESNRDRDFIYEAGKIVSVPDFDEDRWNECAAGIHFFITRQEAVDY